MKSSDLPSLIFWAPDLQRTPRCRTSTSLVLNERPPLSVSAFLNLSLSALHKLNNLFFWRRFDVLLLTNNEVEWNLTTFCALCDPLLKYNRLCSGILPTPTHHLIKDNSVEKCSTVVIALLIMPTMWPGILPPH